MQWDRRDHPPRNEDMLQGGEKPQGIPVIGGGPRPIPTNVTSGRPTPPRRHPDMGQSQGGMDYLPPDIIKLPPHQYPPSGYPPDPHLMGQRRDPGVPLGMHPTGHPIPRLGGQGAPSMPPMMLNQPMHQPPQGHMNHMGYRPRY
uniref:protein tfg-1-like n=1 Tax=Styela clava TaxID=7725 RepID=UPI00193A328C|nr:protein tfg-1-like [Styela clava]